MKQKISCSQSQESEILFTPSAILDLLSKVDEFSEYDLDLTESLDGKIQLQVGNSVYELNPDEVACDIQVSNDVVDEIAAINEEAYQDLLDENDEYAQQEYVESGLIKELVKTLLIGGVVRMGKNYLTH